jgi:branched-chain amino acid transport system substrate-binding protein
VLGAGGVNPDTPEMQAYIKAHTDVTGKAPDYWASPVTYAALQILEQSIEAVGKKDRAAVIAHIKANTFDTVIGPVTFKNQNNEAFWTVGQWQGGTFYGVDSTGRPGAKPVKAKPGW